MSYLSDLINMGFPEEKVVKALDVTGNKGIEPAVDWLLAYASSKEGSQDNSEAEIIVESETPGTVEIRTDESEIQNVQDLVYYSALSKILQCVECNKKLRTDAEVEFHAIKMGHQRFSLFCQERKPMTEEEKMEHLTKLYSIIMQERAGKAERKKREAIKKEKSRRKAEHTGSLELERLGVRQNQHLPEQIERDKQARREKFGMATASTSAFAVSEAASFPPAQTYNECNIQHAPNPSPEVQVASGRKARKSFSRDAKTQQSVPVKPGKRVRSPSSDSSVVNGQHTTSCLMPGRNSSDSKVQNWPLKISAENKFGKKTISDADGFVTPSEGSNIKVIPDDDVDSAKIIESSGNLIDTSLSNLPSSSANSSMADKNLTVPTCHMQENLGEGCLVWVNFGPSTKLFPLTWPGKIMRPRGRKPPKGSKEFKYVNIFGLELLKWIHVDNISPHTDEKLMEARMSTTLDIRFLRAVVKIEEEINLLANMRRMFSTGV